MKEELAVRQNIRNLYRCLDFSGNVRRQQKSRFESFLNHSDEQVRREALAIQKCIADQREERRLMFLEDELWEISYEKRLQILEELETGGSDVSEDEDLPF